MNEHETERIAAAMHQLRPDWPASSLRTLISKHLANRPRRDVAVALAWVACESGTATPARVLEAGPWWKAAGVEGTVSPRNPYDVGENCAVCSLPANKCQSAALPDHEFITAAQHLQQVARRETDVLRVVSELRASTTTPTPAAESATEREAG